MGSTPTVSTMTTLINDTPRAVACNIHNLIVEMMRPEDEWFGKSRRERITFQLDILEASLKATFNEI